MQLINSILALSLFIGGSTDNQLKNREQSIYFNGNFQCVIRTDTVIQRPIQNCPLNEVIMSDSVEWGGTLTIIGIHDIIPPGWRRVAALEMSDESGPPTTWLIGRYSQLPVGSTFVMLAEDPVPPGWDLVKKELVTYCPQKTIIRRK